MLPLPAFSSFFALKQGHIFIQPKSIDASFSQIHPTGPAVQVCIDSPTLRQCQDSENMGAGKIGSRPLGRTRKEGAPPRVTRKRVASLEGDTNAGSLIGR